MEPVRTADGQSPVAMRDGDRVINKYDLPSPDTKRWVINRKAEIVGAVHCGLLTREEALERYRISSQEFEVWCEAVKQHGPLGLRVSRMQNYRKSSGATALPDGGVLRAGDVELDQKTQTVRIGETSVYLSRMESNLLGLLIANAGVSVTKRMMLDTLYGNPEREPEQKILDVVVCNIRRKLKARFGNQVIETVWGRGYTISA